jgi:DNA-binding beta-propeller fold protein YncE
MGAGPRYGSAPIAIRAVWCDGARCRLQVQVVQEIKLGGRSMLNSVLARFARWLRGPVRRLTGFCALAGVCCLVALVIGPAVAEAINTLPFLGSFGAGQFNAPRGVAVDGSSGSSRGDVYVVDTFNQRVEEFNPVGGFIRTFGGQVNETKVKEVEAKGGTPTQKEVEEEDVCTAASGNVCKAGLEGSGGGQFVNPLGVAVDPSSGDVYVADFSNSRIEKFGPAGEFLLAFGKEVDATTSGNICTAASRDTCQAGKEGVEEDEFEWAPAGTFIAVGATGTVYVGDTNRLQEFRSDGSEQGQIPLPGAGQTTALAVDSGGDLYAVSQALTGVRKYSATGALLAEFDPGRESGQLTALAVQPTSGEVFVVDTSEGARIRKYLPEGTLSAESQQGAVVESLGIAVSAAGTVYAADTANSSVLFFGKPPREGNPPPSIDAESVTELGEESAKVEAQINPFFLETSYRVQYVPASGYRPSATEPERYAGPGSGEAPAQAEVLGGGVVLGDQPAHVAVAGLSPGTVYHYRFAAHSSAGTTYGPDQIFATYPSGGFAGLPDERAYEQVSAQKKNGNDAGITSRRSVVFPGYAATSPHGLSFAYRQQGPSGETSSGADEYSVSSRNQKTGWETGAVMPPEDVANGDILGQIPVVLLGSADLSRFLFGATGPFTKENSLTAADENLGLYRTRGNANEPEWISKPTFPSLSEATPEPGKMNQEGVYPAGGSADLSRVYFTYFGTLVPADESRAPFIQPGNSKGPWGFYEWMEGALAVAGTLPSNSPYPNQPDPYGAVPAATGPATGSEQGRTPETRTLLNEVSKDGLKAFFISPEPRHATEAGTPTELYVREQTDGPRTVLVSRDELLPKISGEPTPAPGSGGETAVKPVKTKAGPAQAYVYASADGSRAFFESMDKLAKSASGEEPSGTGPWTYEINFKSEKEEGKPEEGKLTYLPGVVGQIAASSQNGSSFIFKDTATGRFELWSGGPAPVEVASFSMPTEPEFEGAAAKDGTVFVFNTNAVLKRGAQTFNNSAGLKQSYRYDSVSRRLSCVSCAPAGAPQHPIGGTGEGREIADEGARVFFGTAAKLVGRDVNGVEDAYEWEQAGTGGCHSEEREGGCVYLISSGTSPDPSFYLENDESGNNVFFATGEGLVKGDTDESYDVYDARVNGGFPQAASPGECASSCRPPGVSPVLSTPLTTAFGPSGNLVAPAESPPPPKSTPKPLTRAQKLAKALRACAKQPKHKRASCRKQARRQYGTQAKTKRSAGSGGRRG